MKILIHDNQTEFSQRWIACCRQQQLDYTPVNCLDSDIVRQMASADFLLWHWRHGNPAEVLAARPVIRAAEFLGLSVFPDSNTCQTFDDKLAQKYQLEAAGAPLVPTHLFYDQQAAMEWIGATTFPKVFKLRKGAGASNVILVSTPGRAAKLVKKSFGKGFRPMGNRAASDALTKMKQAGNRAFPNLAGKLKRMPATLKRIRERNRMMGREKGYAYFQDFIPGNTHDTRVTVIGEKATAFRRQVRPNDFRASGSGMIDPDPTAVDTRCIRIAFEVANRLKAQSIAFDFVCDPDNRPLIVETSYVYLASVVYGAGGYWDSDLAWHRGGIRPQDLILKNLMAQRKARL